MPACPWEDPSEVSILEDAMASCSGCGAELVPDAAFCTKCGKQVTAAQVAGALPENVVGLLCYLVGPVSGTWFFLTDKRPSVRSHAMRSMVIFGGLFVFELGAMY